MEDAINQRVKKARNLLDLSQDEVAEAINKKVPAISKIEAGSQSVTPELLTFYYRKGINPHWLLTGEGEPFKGEGTNSGKSVTKTGTFDNSSSANNKLNVGSVPPPATGTDIDYYRARIRELEQLNNELIKQLLNQPPKKND